MDIIDNLATTIAGIVAEETADDIANVDRRQHHHRPYRALAQPACS